MIEILFGGWREHPRGTMRLDPVQWVVGLGTVTAFRKVLRLCAESDAVHGTHCLDEWRTALADMLPELDAEAAGEAARSAACIASLEVSVKQTGALEEHRRAYRDKLRDERAYARSIARRYAKAKGRVGKLAEEVEKWISNV